MPSDGVRPRQAGSGRPRMPRRNFDGRPDRDRISVSESSGGGGPAPWRQYQPLRVMMKSLLPWLGAAAPAFLLSGLTAAAANDSIVTAVYSQVSSDYVRHKLPDGSFQREYYALANGGYGPGAAKDPSIDNVKFPAVAGTIAEFLAKQNYFFANDAKSADLLLVITWGTTIPGFNSAPYQTAQSSLLSEMNGYKAADAAAAAVAAAGQGMSVDGIQSPEATIRDEHREALYEQLYQMQLFDGIRRQSDEHNARLLGYLQDINDRDNITRLAGGGTAYDDLISDIEQARYYVILAAYDFRAATQQKKPKLLWVTRVSIQAQGNRFDKDLGGMLANASKYFGQPSHGLIRRYREGTVTIGKLKVVGVEPESAPPARADGKH